MLDIHPAILGSLAICVVLLIWIIWEEQMTRIIIRGIGGMSVLYLGNIILPDFMVLKWDILHIGIALVLGIPGSIIMFFIHYLMVRGIF